MFQVIEDEMQLDRHQSLDRSVTTQTHLLCGTATRSLGHVQLHPARWL